MNDFVCPICNEEGICRPNSEERGGQGYCMSMNINWSYGKLMLVEL